MRDHNNFQENLAFAQNGECTVAEMLLQHVPELVLVEDNAKGKSHDIKVTLHGKPLLIEVKEDVRSADTGNIVVEYESWGKPSGIVTTKAALWIFRVHNRNKTISHFLFKLDNLRSIIKAEYYWKKEQMKHTDSKNKLYFFKRHVLKENADKIW